MFKTKRKEHHYVIQRLGQMPTDVKRYKAVQILMDQIFKVIFEEIEYVSWKIKPSFRYYKKVSLL